jgi:hypothetical protein
VKTQDSFSVNFIGFFLLCFDSLESSSGERLKTVLSIFTFPTESTLKRSISKVSVKTDGIGSKRTLPRVPWSLWCLVHPLYFLVGRGLNVYSTRENTNPLFIALYLSWLRGLSPLRVLKLFKRVRINFFGSPLANTRVHATNSSDEKNSGRFVINLNSWNVNSSQSHLRNKNLKRVDRLPDERTCQPTTSPYFGAMELDVNLNSWKLLRYDLKKSRLWSLGFLNWFFISAFSGNSGELTLASIPCTSLSSEMNETRKEGLNYKIQFYERSNSPL